MTALTHEQKLARNALAEEIRHRDPRTSYLDAIQEATRIVRSPRAASPGPAAAGPQVVSKRAARLAKRVTEALTAAQAPQPPPGTGQAPGAQPTSRTAAPARPLHELSADEFSNAVAATYRDTGGKSPFWTQGARESAPAAPVREAMPPAPGYPPGPAAAALPPMGVPAIPPPDPAKPLSQMDSDEMFQACADWFAAQSQHGGHKSPFWKAA